jgi:RarD protein
LLVSGAALGFNWILLFEAYRYTSVAVATLCYYTAPILVILVAPLVLKERISAKKIVCVSVALLGMFLVSGILDSGSQTGDLRGILFGLGAAILYACVMVLNKLQKEIQSFDRTIFQLGIAALVLLPYNFAVSSFPDALPSLPVTMMLLAVGVLHTGLAYYLYFSSIAQLPGQTVAIISYLDPVIAVAVSVLLLREGTSWQELLGAVLILGAALCSEISIQRKERRL